MTADELRALQSPLKQSYRDDPASALQTLRARGTIDPGSVACRVESAGGPVVAGLHPATGGDGTLGCSAEMLLESLVACAGVTLAAVATAMGIPLRGGSVTAEADWDPRGTLGVDREAPVGLTRVRLAFALDADATDEQRAKLLTLTERYCVIFQTLRHPPELSSSAS